jgi:hypothetical protein
MVMLAEHYDFVIGGDPDRDTIDLAIHDAVTGRVHTQYSDAADGPAYRRLLAWAVRCAPGRRVWALEGTGSFAAGLVTALAEAGEDVVEIQNNKRSRGAKNDRIDGVHATIVVNDFTTPTPYMRRKHDAKLREALSQLKQPNARPRLVTVVGTSSSGKTRTIYEAAKEVLPNWNLVRPSDSSQLTRILEGGIPGNTVVWLDELQEFLVAQGVAAARDIRQILEDTASPPIVFMATILPTNLMTLEQRPDPSYAQTWLGEISHLLRPTADDRHAVPDAFDEDELAAVAQDDPRIAKAIQNAPGTSAPDCAEYW